MIIFEFNLPRRRSHLSKSQKTNMLSIRDKPVVLIIITISCCYNIIADDHFVAFVIYDREDVL